MAELNWVDKRERMPTARDTDAAGAILAWNIHDGVHVTNPHVFAQYGTFYTHWATPPERPKEKKNDEKDESADACGSEGSARC